MKNLITILFLMITVLSFAQYDVIPTPFKQKSREGDMRRDIVEYDNMNTKDDLINERFETWPPANWEIINGTSSTGNQHWHQEGSTNKYAAVQYDNGDGVIKDQDEWMITPDIIVPDNAFLTFEFHSNPYWMVHPNNNADVKVMVSTDGVTWNEIWYEDEFDFEYDVWTEVDLDLSDYEGEALKIAFQYAGSDACWFYIDNVRVYALPEFDIEITEARIDFFEIYDYHEDPDEFHYSSHYAKIPKEILEGNENAYLAFNAQIVNKGFGSCLVQCNVRVKDPDNQVIYNATSFNETEIGEMEVDTIDIAYNAETEFLLDNPKVGVYTVTYTVFVGEPGAIPIEIQKDKEMLTKTVTFEVTEKEFSRAADINDEFIGPKYWEGGGTDGDILTVKYMLFENTEIDNVRAFIHEDTDAGTQVICNIWQYDSNSSSYIIMASSALTTIEAEDLGTWKSFAFTDPAMIITDEEYVATSILVGFEFYYGGEDSQIWLGCDKTSPSSPWGTLWYMLSGTNSNQWYVITNFVGVPMIELMLHDEAGKVENNQFAKSISLYPNPTSDFVKLSGVSGCKIDLYNDLGSRLEQFVATDADFSIDLSQYPSGMYYTVITDLNGEGGTVVKKINVLK